MELVSTVYDVFFSLVDAVCVTHISRSRCKAERSVLDVRCGWCSEVYCALDGAQSVLPEKRIGAYRLVKDVRRATMVGPTLPMPT